MKSTEFASNYLQKTFYVEELLVRWNNFTEIL